MASDGAENLDVALDPVTPGREAPAYDTTGVDDRSGVARGPLEDRLASSRAASARDDTSDAFAATVAIVGMLVAGLFVAGLWLSGYAGRPSRSRRPRRD